MTVSGSQEGAFENIKLNFNGDQGQTMRQLVNAHVVQHKAMCLLVAQHGKRQQMAVAHDKGKVCWYINNILCMGIYSMMIFYSLKKIL